MNTSVTCLWRWNPQWVPKCRQLELRRRGITQNRTNYKVFILQKKSIRIITDTRPRDSCREIFKSMEIMTLYSQYIYSLVLYTVNNTHLFDTSNEIHKYKTRNNNILHRPIANLSKFNNGTYISGIKVFNHLPQHIKALTNDHKYFKSTLKRFLYHHSFYSMNEYYEYKEDTAKFPSQLCCRITHALCYRRNE